jgi:hypothetical protein
MGTRFIKNYKFWTSLTSTISGKLFCKCVNKGELKNFRDVQLIELNIGLHFEFVRIVLLRETRCRISSLHTYIARSNEILDWEGLGNRQLLCFFTAWINWSMLTVNLKFRAKKSFFFPFFAMFLIKNRIT